MKKYLMISLLAVTVVACTNDDDCNDSSNCSKSRLYIPGIAADIENGTPYNGALQAVACYEGGSIYFGNYSSTGSLTPFPGYYNIEDGTANNSTTPLRLPAGNYNILYWGAPSFFTSQSGILHEPTFVIGEAMKDKKFSLYARTDTTYQPTYELVFGLQAITIGKDSLHAHLWRATSSMNVTVMNSDGSDISSTIDTMWVHIGKIANSINAFTGIPTNQTKTVSFGLERNIDNKQFNAQGISLLPSAANPPMALFIKLSNGTQKKFTQNLINTLAAGTLTTVTLTLNGTISSETSTGSFTVEDWVEQSETIDIPLQ